MPLLAEIFEQLEKFGEYAPGLPDKASSLEPRLVEQPEKWELSIQKHTAKRAGEHFDIRLGDPERQVAYSWAGRRLPEPGETVEVKKQPDHTIEYMNFKGTIAEGYGAGKVELFKRTITEVLPSQSGKALKFNLYDEKYPQEFVLIPKEKESWLLVNRTPSRTTKPYIPDWKPKYQEMDPADIDINDDNLVVSPKLDGAHGIIDLQKGRPLRIYSYRAAKGGTGLIDHTRKFEDLNEVRAKLDGVTLRGELIAVDKQGKVLPANKISGILNSSVWNARDRQHEQDVHLMPVVFGVDRWKGRPVPATVGYGELRRMLDAVAEAHPEIPIVAFAENPEDKKKLIEEVRNKEYQLTGEGVVLHTRDSETPPIKAVFKKTWDVYVKDVFQEKDKDGKLKEQAGGFSYAFSPRGKIVGRVGSGLDRELKKLIWQDPNAFKGKVVTLEAPEQYPSKALRKPVFKRFHLDKNEGEFLRGLQEQGFQKQAFAILTASVLADLC